MSRLRFVGPPRRSFRYGPASSARVGPICARHCAAQSARAASRSAAIGASPAIACRRLVLLLDVSGSMEPYARAMLRFVHAAVAGRQRVEAFALGTRLTRVTKELNSRDPDLALQQASQRVQDWSGGTRLGECLRRFNDEWGVRGMARARSWSSSATAGTVATRTCSVNRCVRLQRVTYDLIWVNPLKVTPGYAPWPVAWRPRCRMLITSWKVIHSWQWKNWPTSSPASRRGGPDARTARRHRSLAVCRQAGGDRPRRRHRRVRPREVAAHGRQRDGEVAGSSAVAAWRALSSARRWRS